MESGFFDKITSLLVEDLSPSGFNEQQQSDYCNSLTNKWYLKKAEEKLKGIKD